MKSVRNDSRFVLDRAPSLHLCYFVLAAFIGWTRGESADQNPAWKAGAAAVVITPKTLMPMAGYAARMEPAEGTEQELFAKAPVIEDHGSNRVVLLTMDLIGVVGRLRTRVTEQAVSTV